MPDLRPVRGREFTGIEQQLEAGKIQVRYHIINLLDSRSNPPGYSLMAANTIVANGGPVDWQASTWLTDLVNTAYQQK